MYRKYLTQFLTNYCILFYFNFINKMNKNIFFYKPIIN